MSDRTHNRNTGIGHLAARSLIEEISALRDEIAHQGMILQSIDVAMTAMYRELQQTSRPAHLREN